MTMSLSRRLQLLAWAKLYNTPIFEDDYDSEFRFSGSRFQQCRDWTTEPR